MPYTHLHRTGFRTQLTVIMTGAILGLALFSSLMNSWEASRRMGNYILAQGQQTAENLARQSRLAILFHAPENGKEGVAATLASPDVLQVEIIDSSGSVLISESKKGVQKIGLPAGPELARREVMLEQENESAWVFGAPVTDGAEEASPFDVTETAPRRLGYVHVVVSKASLNQLAHWLLIGNLAISFSFAIVLVGLMRLLTQRMTRPLKTLSDLMSRAEKGELGMRATPEGPRDLINMAAAFNKMMTGLEERELALTDLNVSLESKVQARTAELSALNDELNALVEQLKTTQENLIQSEKNAALGRLVAGIAHELNTPIGNALLVSTALSHNFEEFEQHVHEGLKRSNVLQHIQAGRDASQLLDRNLQRAAELISTFKQVAVDQSSSSRRKFDLADLVSEVLMLLKPMLAKTAVEVKYQIPAGIAMDSYPGPLSQVVINLINNAIMHAYDNTGQGIIQIDASCPLPGWVEIRVRDFGAGIPSENLGHIFDPFFTTKLGAGGTGLGLNITYNIVTNLLEGKIYAYSSVGEGTLFLITIPTAPSVRTSDDAPVPYT